MQWQVNMEIRSVRMEEFEKIIAEYQNEVKKKKKKQPKKVKNYDEAMQVIIDGLNFIMLQNQTIIKLLCTDKEE